MTQPGSAADMPSATPAVQERTTARGRPERRVLALVVLAALLAGAPGPALAGAPDSVAWWPPLDRPPLDPSFAVTGDFGEYRTGHFHAGLDFNTGGVVGQPLVAGLDGEIVRVRASGVGYGRSLYLQGHDGRMLVYGHLDAFAEPLASYVAAVQESSGQYEQDLWPAAGTFRVRAGQRLAWTGNSGAGGPHFHLEIRRADMAYNPVRAGLGWRDTVVPRIAAVWLEPLDDSSWVERSAAPRRVVLGARVDTVRVLGRVRAVLDAWDPAAGGDAMAPWSTEVEWDGVTTAVVFDSVSWADGMSEIDYVYDRGRVTDQPRRALAPWAAAGVRPRVVLSDAPLDRDAGTLHVRAGDPPRTVVFRARDLAGHVTERALVVRAPRPGEGAGGPVGRRAGAAAGVPAADASDPDGEFAWTGLHAARFEPETVRFRTAVAADLPAALARVSSTAWELSPTLTPLRVPFRVSVRAPAGARVDRIGIAQDDGSGWSWVRASYDSATRRLTADVRRLGRFALVEDRDAPSVHAPSAPRAAARAPYSRWALEARAGDAGSGLDARHSHLVVDGKRVPTEWDPEARMLRWKPLARPAKGVHRVIAVAVDRAGNSRRVSGRFVLD